MSSESEEEYCVLVTGTNGGLGYAICCRLIDEFLHTRPQSQRLRLISTTRSLAKSNDTVRRLKDHIKRAAKQADKSLPGVSGLLEKRILLQPEQLDLCSLRSVQALSTKLSKDLTKLDAVILNAGLGGWKGLNWPVAIWGILTDLIGTVTWPTYKIAEVGTTTKPQIKRTDGGKADEPPLGELFCANVFGHYILVHDLMEKLSEADTGRVIWISSLEAYAWTFEPEDLQGLRGSAPYESTKRLTDILTLTSTLPATESSRGEYFLEGSQRSSSSQHSTPRMYVCQPGICATSIMPLPTILEWCMVAAFYIARWLGSMWHTCTGYKGACAPVWLALSPQETLDKLEAEGGSSKWGSAVDYEGNERVERSEIEGWGYGGVPGDTKIKGGIKRGRKRGAKDLTAEARAQFEMLGVRCWADMEKLRKEWQRRLDHTN